MKAGAQRLLWWAVFVLASVPACHLLLRFYHDDLGPDPLVTLEHGTGFWAFVLLVVTLSITPIRRLTRWNQVIKLRKMLGNWSAAYAVAHVSIYLWLDQGFDWRSIWVDALEHKRLFLGVLAFLILLILSATSPTFMIARLGRRWATIHKLVYAAVVLALIHFALTQKLDWREPIVWGGVVAVLLGSRLWWSRASEMPVRKVGRTEGSVS